MKRRILFLLLFLFLYSGGYLWLSFIAEQIHEVSVRNQKTKDVFLIQIPSDLKSIHWEKADEITMNGKHFEVLQKFESTLVLQPDEEEDFISSMRDMFEKKSRTAEINSKAGFLPLYPIDLFSILHVIKACVLGYKTFSVNLVIGFSIEALQPPENVCI